VLGASMSGLLATRVLADHFRTVTVVERDVLDTGGSNRRGVPQGRHPHALLARGARTFDEFFPGILDDLVAAGAPVLDDADYSRLYMAVGGHVLPRSGFGTPYPRSDAMYQASRPLLERTVRDRVMALPNVRVTDNHEMTELLATPDRGRVNGVRIMHRDGSAARDLEADLVVDATGRGGRTPALLEALGYPRPTEDQIVTRTTYVTVPLRLTPDALREIIVLIGPAPGRPNGMFLFRNEHDTWLFTIFAMGGVQPPGTVAGMTDFARTFCPEHVLAALRRGEQVAPAVQHRLPSSRWRRYDKLRRFPAGLLVTGDAVCSFNPIYGQGMSVAAMDALALRDSLRDGLEGASRRYFRASAKGIGVAWGLAAGPDLGHPEVEGRRTPAMRLTRGFADWVLGACETDAVVHGQFLRVTGLIDPPARMLHPVFLYRVAAARRRRRPYQAATADVGSAAAPAAS
jgi:2-polyprenyl-6-methoxyphenol hydroxylase-like FAD-dependent oxidoreductase